MRSPTHKELRLLLLRLSRKLPERLRVLEAETQKNPRDIRLGLERVQRAIPKEQLWQGVHVAGTNGKGSICAYLSGLCAQAGTSYGRFTSPAFPEKRHGVVIDGQVPHAKMYDQETVEVLSRFEKVLKGFLITSGQNPGDLSPFEIETATAFGLFNRLKVSYGIVEVGMGGSTDATNAMKNKAVTIISKIGMDHAEYLGGTIQEIARMKAGIMARGVPCIVDDSNEPEVMEVLEDHAWNISAPLVLSSKGDHLLKGLDHKRWRLEDWQRQNLLCAVTAFNQLFPRVQMDLDELMESNPALPGRMQTIRFKPFEHAGTETTALVDGAHNPLAMEHLAQHVDNNLRTESQPVTWIIGFSKSDTKPFEQMLGSIIRPGDNVAFVEYKQQANEPPPLEAATGRRTVLTCLNEPESERAASANISLPDALRWARDKAGDTGSVVITGSLYLVRDLLSLPEVKSNSSELETRNVGSTVYKALAKKKSSGKILTDEEMISYKAAKRKFDKRAKDRMARREQRRLEAQELIDGGAQPMETVVTTNATMHTKNLSKPQTTIAKEVADSAETNTSPSTPLLASKKPDAASTEEVTGSIEPDMSLSTPLPESDPVATSEEAVFEKGQSATALQSEQATPPQTRVEQPKRVPPPALKTPFWRDPDSPGQSLPDPSGKPTKSAMRRMARAARLKEIELEKKALLEARMAMAEQALAEDIEADQPKPKRKPLQYRDDPYYDPENDGSKLEDEDEKWEEIMKRRQ